MRLRILGRMEAENPDGPVTLGPPKQRLTLAVLLLNAGRVVSTDRLVDSLWGGRPPASGPQNVHLHIHRIRRALGAERLSTCGRDGYRLTVSRGELDTYRFLDLLDRARRADAAGDRILLAVLLRDALAEWRGVPYAEFGAHPELAGEAEHLAELRLRAIEQLTDVDLTLGLHAELVARLRPVVAENPYRERFHEQLAVALYRSDRAPEALAALRDARRTFADDLGMDTGPGLRRLETDILTRAGSLWSGYRGPAHAR